MKHTSLFIKLCLTVFVLLSFSISEAANNRNSRGNTGTRTKAAGKGGTSKQAPANTSQNQQNQQNDQYAVSDPNSSEYSNDHRATPLTANRSFVCRGKTINEDVAGQCDFGFSTATCNCMTEAEAAGANHNNSNDSNKSGGSACVADLKKLVQQCEGDVSSAVGKCDSSQDSEVQTKTSDLARFAADIGGQVAVTKPCSGIAKYVGGLNAALGGYAVICSNSRDSCMSSCRKAVQAIATKGNACEAQWEVSTLERSANNQYNVCRDLETRVDQARTAVQSIVQTVKGAQGCDKQTQTEVSDYCKANPTALGCAAVPQECADPAFAAANQICFCSGPGAASNPKCRAAMKNTSVDFNSPSNIPSNITGSDKDPIFTNEKPEWGGIPDYKPGSNQGEDPGGKKGGRPVESGSGGSKAGGPDAGGGPGDPVAGPQINNGFRGAAGSGGGGFGGGSGGGDGQFAGGTAAGGDAAGNGGPDLRQFLPGGKYAPGSRGVAGLTGPDGITGPHDNLWKKIKNRYQAQQPTFLGH